MPSKDYLETCIDDVITWIQDIDSCERTQLETNILERLARAVDRHVEVDDGYCTCECNAHDRCDRAFCIHHD